ncbi:hypothetical protein Droror1_Dr00001193 [Drosera rotundifolia]
MTYDYLRFLCYCGYSDENILLLSSTEMFTSPKISLNSLITNINYPSISIGILRGNHTAKVKEKGLTGTIFNVSFHGKGAPKGYNFGSVTWFDGLHTVRIIFAVNIV